MWRLLMALFGAIAAAAAIAAIYTSRDAPSVTVTDSATIEGVVRVDNLPRDHDNSIEYPAESLPPMGGVHASAWLNCGVYDDEVSVANALHSLEHGAIWITYQPDLDEMDVERLRELTRETDHRLLSPYEGQASPIVLTAWGRQLELDAIDDERLMVFIETFESAPSSPEPGVTCAGGVGSPLR